MPYKYMHKAVTNSTINHIFNRLVGEKEKPSCALHFEEEHNLHSSLW
jgi:hypothetical protein